MLHLGDDDLVARTQRSTDRVGQQVQALGDVLVKMIRVVGGTEEGRDFLAPASYSAWPLRQGVDAAVHVGVVTLVVIALRVQYAAASGSSQRYLGKRADPPEMSRSRSRECDDQESGNRRALLHVVRPIGCRNHARKLRGRGLRRDQRVSAARSALMPLP